jgi:hypothetical protein
MDVGFRAFRIVPCEIVIDLVTAPVEAFLIVQYDPDVRPVAFKGNTTLENVVVEFEGIMTHID